VIFDRLRSKKAARPNAGKPSRRELAEAAEASEQAFNEFILTRPGVAAWVEEPTGFNKASLLLVAGSGEWLRRQIPDTDWGREFAARAQLTCYTAGLDPYPQRMRTWDTAHRQPSTGQTPVNPQGK